VGGASERVLSPRIGNVRRPGADARQRRGRRIAEGEHGRVNQELAPVRELDPEPVATRYRIDRCGHAGDELEAVAVPEPHQQSPQVFPEQPSWQEVVRVGVDPSVAAPPQEIVGIVLESAHAIGADIEQVAWIACRVGDPGPVVAPVDELDANVCRRAPEYVRGGDGAARSRADHRDGLPPFEEHP
jgi:hypothetical protein